MNINFNVYAPSKTGFSTLKNQNFQKTSFTGDYLDLYNAKKEQLENEFFEIIVPEATDELDNIEKEAYEASAAYYNMLNRGAEAHVIDKNNHKIATLSKKQNGLKKDKIVKIYEGKNLTREINILSCNHTIIKKFNNDGTYDLYECNHAKNTAKCCKNVKEAKTLDNYTYDADKIYEFNGRFLTKYEEGYHLTENEEEKQLYVEKSFERLENQTKRCQCLEGALYGFSIFSKSPKLQEFVSCLKF